MVIRFKTVTQYKGLFDNCTMEPIIHGWSIFDKKGHFVGYILENGFAVNLEYQFADEIQRQLARKGITAFDVKTYEAIKHDRELDEH